MYLSAQRKDTWRTLLENARPRASPVCCATVMGSSANEIGAILVVIGGTTIFHPAAGYAARRTATRPDSVSLGQLVGLRIFLAADAAQMASKEGRCQPRTHFVEV
jgi:hypothetical protein